MQNSVLSIRMTSLYWFQPLPLILCMKQRLKDHTYRSVGVPALICGFVMQNRVLTTRINCPYESQTSCMDFCIQNSDFVTRITSLYGSQTSPKELCMKNSIPTTGIKSLNGSQTSSMDFCKQNSALCTKITSLYVSQTSPVDFCMQNRDLGPELQFSMGPSPHLWFLHAKQRL